MRSRINPARSRSQISGMPSPASRSNSSRRDLGTFGWSIIDIFYRIAATGGATVKRNSVEFPHGDSKPDGAQVVVPVYADHKPGRNPFLTNTPIARQRASNNTISD